MSPFAERLKVLMGEQHVAEVASTLGIARSAVYAWLAGDRLPKAANLEQLLGLVGKPKDRETWELYLQAQVERTRIVPGTNDTSLPDVRDGVAR